MDANTAMALAFAVLTLGLPAWAWRIHRSPATGRGLPKDLRILACLAFALVAALGLLSMFLAALVH